MQGADATTVTTRLLAKPGREEELAAVLTRFAATVRGAEGGCLEYRLARSQHDARHFLVVERYRDAEALAAHANSGHLREVLPELMECLESLPDVGVFDDLPDLSDLSDLSDPPTGADRAGARAE